MKKFILILINIYMVLIMFGGIIVKFCFGNIMLIEFKSMLPDIVLIFIIVMSIMEIIMKKNIKKTISIIEILIIFMSYIIVFNLNKVSSFENVLFVLRDTYLPMLACVLLSRIDFTDTDKIKTIKSLKIIFIIEIIFGFILALVQLNMGSEWTAKFYTGYFFYGIDPISGIKISHTNGMLRIPSVAGNSALFGFYNLIAYLFMKNFCKKNKIMLSVIAIFNIILSTNKSVLVIIFIELFISISLKLKTYGKNLVLIIMGISIMIISIILYYINPDIYFSSYERLMYWKIIVLNLDIKNLLIPCKLFLIGAGSSGIYSVVDNSYIYFMLSYGLVGIILYIGAMILMLKKSLILKNNIMISFLVAILYGGITTNIFQARVLIAPIMLIMFLFYNKCPKKGEIS